MRDFKIATGLSRQAATWKNTTVTWEELLTRLGETTRTKETQAEYKALSKARQDSIKDVGGFVGGSLQGGKRKRDCVTLRSLLTLDADFAAPDFCDAVEMFAEYTYCIYSTHKHTPEKPRLRLVIPLSRDCTAEEYEAAARKIAEGIGIDQFDDTTYQAHRLMYWPSTSRDGEYIFRHGENKLLDVDKVLSSYHDWHDVSEWPTSSRTVKATEQRLKKQEDPTAKKGVIGAFCRTYDIHQAIGTFLSDVYTPCVGKDRYTYSGGSTSAGLVVYEDGKFAYSNHATDPAGGVLCNAFDLVRLHRYGDLDRDAKDGTPTPKLPSFLAMQELASNDKGVRLLMHQERLESCREDFAGIESERETSWILDLATDRRGNNLPTIDNCIKIYANDDRIKGRLSYNLFTRRYTVRGALPWNGETAEREWTDTDDAGLRHYTETVYGIKSQSAVKDAWALVCMENKYNPVQDYLVGLQWDGAPRAERLFVDYLGADDSVYVRAVSRKMLAAAVARIFEPGCKYDNVPVLVGEQGAGKSFLSCRLGRKWFSDTLTTVQGKEAYEQLQGFWIIEIAELSALKRNEVEAVKHFTAKSEDAYRAAYGHHTEVRKRQCIFIGTTNQREFLRDQTGNRRFLPIDTHPERATRDVFHELTDTEVDQLWAEAVQLYRAGEKLYMETAELRDLAKQEQESHFEESPLTGDVLRYLDTLLPENWNDLDLPDRRLYLTGGGFGAQPEGSIRRDRVCPLEIWCEAFGGDRKDFNYQKCKEIKDIIQRTGEWVPIKGTLRFGKEYGPQRGFVRKQ